MQLQQITSAHKLLFLLNEVILKEGAQIGVCYTLLYIMLRLIPTSVELSSQELAVLQSVSKLLVWSCTLIRLRASVFYHFKLFYYTNFLPAPASLTKMHGSLVSPSILAFQFMIYELTNSLCN